MLFYYRLTNFYQNHRRYVKSYDQDQLSGTARSNGSIDSSDCDPLQLDHNGKAYYPCGLIANSMFNDTFSSPVAINAEANNAPNTTYEMTKEGISWDSDKELYKTTKYTEDQVVPPPFWRARYPEYSLPDYPLPDLQTMYDFQVWMRTAGLPNFSKLALRNDTTHMAVGQYQVEIQDCE